VDIPRYLKIGPFRYTVELHEGYWNKDDIRVYGEVDERTATINLDVDASAEVIRDAILHEILHAILLIYDKDDEDLVRLLTPILLGVIRDNPKLMLALTT
jgi:hypothetical protein